MKEEKKPDHVVFDEETQTYNAKLLPYANSVSAPKITPPDITSWKNSHIIRANNEFKAKYDAIQEDYKKLMESYELNTLVYNAKFNFEPIVGNCYHLYQSKNERTFLSIIPPEECSFHHLGSFKLGPDKTWLKI